MLSQLENAFGVSVEDEQKTLIKAVSTLDKTLFDGYVKPKAAAVAVILREGILDKDMDWCDTPQHTEIRLHKYKALMGLVEIHTQNSHVAENLLERGMYALVDIGFRVFRSTNAACLYKLISDDLGALLASASDDDTMLHSIRRLLLQFPATLPLPLSRRRANTPPSPPLSAGRTFFDHVRSSSVKGKQRSHELQRHTASTASVPLGQATYAVVLSFIIIYRDVQHIFYSQVLPKYLALRDMSSFVPGHFGDHLPPLGEDPTPPRKPPEPRTDKHPNQ
ncbi:hypothetical protein EDD22DRAFT_971931 [Suillus occidentalis]|nr:hypothetical protein EDD22DRAFT_971931 [Suillus occidentalis]